MAPEGECVLHSGSNASLADFTSVLTSLLARAERAQKILLQSQFNFSGFLSALLPALGRRREF